MVFSSPQAISAAVLFILLLNGCAPAVRVVDRDRGPRAGSIDVSGIPDAVPRHEPRSKYGNPPSYVVFGKRYYVMESGDNFVERGIASWYGEKFHGRRTSSGEPYDMFGMTAAHKSLPLPTYVEVINLENGKRVVLKVNDRGPFHENRVIDLSYTAAKKLDILQRGTGLVEVRSIDPDRFDGAQRGVAGRGLTVRTDTEYNSTGFYIQVGAYSELGNAMTMRKKLGPLGDKLLSISEVRLNGGALYRVRFGPITDVALADRIVENLRDYGVFDHYITIE